MKLRIQSRTSAGWLLLVTSLKLALVLALAGCAAQTAFRNGQALWQDGKPKEALAKLEEASRLDPESAPYRLAYVQARERYVQTLLQSADRARDQQRWPEAEQGYRSILEVPGQQQEALERLRLLDQTRRLVMMQREVEASLTKQDWEAARERMKRLELEAPQWDGLAALRQQLEHATQASAKPNAPATLSKAYKQPISLEFRDVPLRTVFDVISRTSGLNFVFDRDIRPDQRASIYLRNSTVEAALAWLMRTNQLEQRVLDGNTLLIYPASPNKLSEYQPLVVKSFYLSNTDAKTVAATLKTLLKSKDVVVDEKLNLLIMRDTPEAIRLAERMVALQDVPEPEVMLEVEVLEVSRTRLMNLGIAWPDQASLTLLPSGSSSTLTLEDLRNPGRSNVGVTVGSATINAKKQDGDTNLLANPRIRARNREKAKILIGDKVPNITTNWSNTGFAGETITYVEVGLKLDVEPTIYLDNEVAIKLALEVSNVTGQQTTKNGSLAYQIGTRTAQTVLRLKDGENQVLAGLINADDRSSANKIPGLGDLPLIGRLFGQQSDNASKTEIVLSITPRILRNVRRPESHALEFESGTENNFKPWPTGLTPLPAARAVSGPGSVVPTEAAGVHGAPANLGETAQLEIPNHHLAWRGPPQVRPGEVFTAQLQLKSDQVMDRLPLVVSFDPKAVQVVAVAPGPYLQKVSGNFEQQVDVGGQVKLSLKPGLPQAGQPVGTVLELTLRALPTVAGNSLALEVQSSQPRDVAGKDMAKLSTAPLTVGVNRQP